MERRRKIHPAHIVRLAAIIALVASASSCRGIAEPMPVVMLQVTNGTCGVAGCDSLVIVGFPVRQPGTPGGLWGITLGSVTTAQGCLRMMDAANFFVNGKAATSWSSTDAIALAAYAPKSAHWPQAPTTAPFVPAGASGWSIAFPDGTVVTAGAACTP